MTRVYCTRTAKGQLPAAIVVAVVSVSHFAPLAKEKEKSNDKVSKEQKKKGSIARTEKKKINLKNCRRDFVLLLLLLLPQSSVGYVRHLKHLLQL